MTGDCQPHIVGLPSVVPIVQLASTTCQHVYEPDYAAFASGSTGCPRCGGWTWIAQLPPEGVA